MSDKKAIADTKRNMYQGKLENRAVIMVKPVLAGMGINERGLIQAYYYEVIE